MKKNYKRELSRGWSLWAETALSENAMWADQGSDNHCPNNINYKCSQAGSGKGPGRCKPTITPMYQEIFFRQRGGREEEQPPSKTGHRLGDTGNNISSKLLLGSKCANLIKSFSASLSLSTPPPPASWPPLFFSLPFPIWIITVLDQLIGVSGISR